MLTKIIEKHPLIRAKIGAFPPPGGFTFLTSICFYFRKFLWPRLIIILICHNYLGSNSVANISPSNKISLTHCSITQIKEHWNGRDGPLFILCSFDLYCVHLSYAVCYGIVSQRRPLKFSDSIALVLNQLGCTNGRLVIGV